jgi:DNA-directed RNA polymerase specialized sigma subunit
MEIKEILEMLKEKLNSLNIRDKEIILSFYFSFPQKNIKNIANKEKVCISTIIRKKTKF